MIRLDNCKNKNIKPQKTDSEASAKSKERKARQNERVDTGSKSLPNKWT